MLTPKKRQFALEYLVDLNAAAAARRAGYSPKTSDRTGYDLLCDPEVAELIRVAQEERVRRTQITADMVVREIARIAFLDPRGFYRPDGSLKPTADWTDEQAAAVCSIESAEEQQGSGDDRATAIVRKIKFWPKVDSLKLLAQHLGIIDRTKAGVSVNVHVDVKTEDMTDDQITSRSKELEARIAAAQRRAAPA